MFFRIFKKIHQIIFLFIWEILKFYDEKFSNFDMKDINIQKFDTFVTLIKIKYVPLYSYCIFYNIAKRVLFLNSGENVFQNFSKNSSDHFFIYMRNSEILRWKVFKFWHERYKYSKIWYFCNVNKNKIRSFLYPLYFRDFL